MVVTPFFINPTVMAIVFKGYKSKEHSMKGPNTGSMKYVWYKDIHRLYDKGDVLRIEKDGKPYQVISVYLGATCNLLKLIKYRHK